MWLLPLTSLAGGVSFPLGTEKALMAVHSEGRKQSPQKGWIRPVAHSSSHLAFSPVASRVPPGLFLRQTPLCKLQPLLD